MGVLSVFCTIRRPASRVSTALKSFLSVRTMAHGTQNKVLSIQSHVVHGYVGNKSATFPLQVLGFEVDAINSVQFSNHTGYHHIKGQILNEKDLADVFEGLCLNELHGNYSHLLTGYIGNASFLREIAKIVRKMREANSNLIYVCDPVMGDNGKMYVPPELLPIYRDEIVPLADIVTPNQYEVELITERKMESEKDAWTAMQWFHDRNIKTVALSSTNLGKSNELLSFLSQKDGSKYTLSIPKQGNGMNFTGTGDLFAALFLAHSSRCKNISEAFEFTIATLQAVIKRTIKCMPQEVTSGGRKPTSSELELKLIQSKKDIEEPEIVLKAKTA